MERKRILCAEDNQADAELILEALGGLGLGEQVAWVRDGVEALEYLRREGEYARQQPQLPDLVLLDLRMPRMGGLETLAGIRADRALRALPVVILTSANDAGSLRRGYELRANAYVLKPATAERLARAVELVGTFWLNINEPPPQVLATGR